MNYRRETKNGYFAGENFIQNLPKKLPLGLRFLLLTNAAFRLFDKKYSKNSNTVKYDYNFKNNCFLL